MNCLTQGISFQSIQGFNVPNFFKSTYLPLQRAPTSSSNDRDNKGNNYLSNCIKPSYDPVPQHGQSGFTSYDKSSNESHYVHNVPSLLSFPKYKGFDTDSLASMANNKNELYKHSEATTTPSFDSNKFGDDVSNWQQRYFKTDKSRKVFQPHNPILPCFEQNEEILPMTQVHDPQVFRPLIKIELEENNIHRTLLPNKNEVFMKREDLATNNIKNEHFARKFDNLNNSMNFPTNNKEQSDTYKINHVFNNKLIFNQQRNALTMQYIHNRASEKNMTYDLNSFWDNLKEKQIQDSSVGMSTKHNLCNYDQTFPRNKHINKDMFNHNTQASHPRKKLFRNEPLYDRKMKLSKIDKIFDNFVPSMRDTIVSPEFVMKLINLHKNNKTFEAKDETILRPGTSSVEPLILVEHNTKAELTHKLEPDELLAHFNRLDESFLQFASSNQNFRALCKCDQNELLHKNSLLFTMVSICENCCYMELFMICIYVKIYITVLLSIFFMKK
jgi:hypothetical protein